MRSQGLELALNGQATQKLAYTMAYTYMDAKFTQYDNYNLLLGNPYRTYTIEHYDLTAPATLDEVGVFANPDLQALYQDLIATGQGSLADALWVGAAIEEIDILDLQDYIAASQQPDIIQVYENLQKGSRNHLRAFVSSWERQTGEDYEAQYMTADELATIVSASVEGGPGAGQSGRGNGARGRGNPGGSGRGLGGNR